MAKQSQIEKAIEALQRDIDVLTLAQEKLKQQLKTSKPKASPRQKVEALKVG